MSPDAPSRIEPRIALPERYRLRRHIATGGMASVWCADDLLLDRSVAVKVLSERFAHDAHAVRRFQREARAAARVSDHPHVVTIYDVGELAATDGVDATLAAGRTFIVMEFLAGGTVADAVHHDAVRPGEALRWLREAAAALDHAHARGIVHRDIKPANFLLDRARVLHVADFGIARLTSEETITNADQLFGTAAYLSPEQALGREATDASDRYALAVAAFELLTGDRPFSAPHFSAQARQHIEEPPPAASDLERSLPPAVDDVLFAGLAKDPAARPPTASAFVSALTAALERRSPPDGGQTRSRASGRRPDPAVPVASTAAARRSETTRATAVSTPPADHRRRRVIALGALAVAVLVLVGIGLTTLHRSAGVAQLADRGAAAAHAALLSPATTARTRVPPARTTATTSTTVTSPAPTAVQLADQGHAEVLDGDYTTAIDALQRAIDTAPPTSDVYADALYDLGHAELLAGDPQKAVTLLRQRLQIGDDRAVVQSLLDTALEQAGDDGGVPASGATAQSTTTTTSTPSTTSTTGRGSGGAGLAVREGDGGDTRRVPGPRSGVNRRHHAFSPLTLVTAAIG